MNKSGLKTRIRTHPRATQQGLSSAGVTLPFQRSLHRKQCRRKVDKKYVMNFYCTMSNACELFEHSKFSCDYICEILEGTP